MGHNQNATNFLLLTVDLNYSEGERVGEGGPRPNRIPEGWDQDRRRRSFESGSNDTGRGGRRGSEGVPSAGRGSAAQEQEGFGPALRGDGFIG